MAHKWARWLHNPCCLGGIQHFSAEHKIRGGPQVGCVVTLAVPPREFPMLRSGASNDKWTTCGQGGYIIPAALGVPNASEEQTQSGLTQKWPRSAK